MRKLLGALAVAGLAATAALAQPVSPTGLTGNESWSCALGGPGGPSTFCTANLMRNTAGYVIPTSSPGVPLTTGTWNAPVSAVANIFGTALTGAVTVNTPAAPYDGEILIIANGTAAAFTGLNITLAPSGSQTVINNTATALAAGASAEWRYSAAGTGTWYRIR